MHGEWGKVFADYRLRFIFSGILAYLVTCIQCAIQVTLSVQEIIHFTDWVVGHAHLVLFGTFSFFGFAWFYYLLPKLAKQKIYSETLVEWHFWGSLLGIVIMDVALMCAGLVQGFQWKSLTPFVESLRVSSPFWWARTFAGVSILVGTFAFVINVWMTFMSNSTSAQKAEVQS